jgi:inhibitor of cysteine peptidase
MVGLGGTRTWIIIAKDPGNQKFSASYRRSWEPVTGNETAYSVNIRVVKG